MLLPEEEEKLSRLGKHIVELRAKRNLKQYELSDLLDIDVRVIRRIEKGKMNFKIHMLFRLATALNVSPESLIEMSFGKDE